MKFGSLCSERLSYRVQAGCHCQAVTMKNIWCCKPAGHFQISSVPSRRPGASSTAALATNIPLIHCCTTWPWWYVVIIAVYFLLEVVLKHLRQPDAQANRCPHGRWHHLHFSGESRIGPWSQHCEMRMSYVCVCVCRIRGYCTYMSACTGQVPKEIIIAWSLSDSHLLWPWATLIGYFQLLVNDRQQRKFNKQ